MQTSTNNRYDHNITNQARSCAKIMIIGDYNSDIEKTLRGLKISVPLPSSKANHFREATRNEIFFSGST